MLSIRRLSLLLVLAITLFSCGSDKERFRYPLSIGSTWTYQRDFTYFNTQTLQMDVDTEIMTVVADQIATSPDGEECIRLRTHSTGQPQDEYDYTYVVNRADGFYELGYDFNYLNIPLKGNKNIHRGSLFNPILKDNPPNGVQWYRNPKLLMPYEFDEDTFWDYRDSNFYTTFNIMPREHITFRGGSFFAFKRRCDMTFSGVKDDFLWT
jgi:hypothetical protein